MSDLKGNRHLFGFEPAAARTLRVTVREIAIARGWNESDEIFDLREKPPLPREVSTRLSGVGYLEQDRLQVIGEQGTQTQRVRFELIPYNTFDDLTAFWNQQKEYVRKNEDPVGEIAEFFSDDDGREILKWFRHNFARFEVRPPTCWIGFSKADWEIGTKNEWWMECRVPRSTYDEIVKDLLGGRAEQLTCAITLAPPFTDQYHAPPSVSVTLGLLKERKYDSGTARGWLDSVGWSIYQSPEAPSHNRAADTFDSDDLEVNSRPTNEEASDGSALVSLNQLARTINRGLIMVFVLLALVILFR
jgi:hypothetical protein